MAEVELSRFDRDLLHQIVDELKKQNSAGGSKSNIERSFGDVPGGSAPSRLMEIVEEKGGVREFYGQPNVQSVQ